MTKLLSVDQLLYCAQKEMRNNNFRAASKLIEQARNSIQAIEAAGHIAASIQAVGDAAQIAAKELEKFVAAARQVT